MRDATELARRAPTRALDLQRRAVAALSRWPRPSACAVPPDPIVWAAGRTLGAPPWTRGRCPPGVMAREFRLPPGRRVHGREHGEVQARGEGVGERRRAGGAGEAPGGGVRQRSLRASRSSWCCCRSTSRPQGLKVVVIFEGRDAAGKGGVIKRITERLNPRVVPRRRPRRRRPSARRPSGTSSATSTHLPAAGEMVLFDRSWYNRAGVERVMGFCTERGVPGVPALLPGVRADARALGDHPGQVLVLASATTSRSGASRPASTTRCGAGSSARWT